MGLVVELVRARGRIKELETKLVEKDTLLAEKESDLSDLSDLLEQLGLGKEIPSPADIVKKLGITVDNITYKIIVDLCQLNIPFTKVPISLPIMDIPDTNSMDGLFDMGNNNLYIEPADEENHQIMVDWIAHQWQYSVGLQTVDCVYRIMENEIDDPRDFTKPHKWYAIHRLVNMGIDFQGRYFWFAGVRNLDRDPFICRDKNILWLNIGTIN